MGARLSLPRGLAGSARRLAEGFAELLWPTRCAGCDAPGHLLCPECAARLPVIGQRHACPRCGAPFGSLVCTECTACLERRDDALDAPPAGETWLSLDGVRCFGVHAWPLDSLVRVYKDGGERRAAALLARFAAAALLDAADVPGAVAPGELDAVVFVPATPAAYARRGFDHMEPLAREAAHLLGLPLADVLARRDASDQRGLSRTERSRNARGSMVVLGRLDGARLLLMDDVVTTGATMGAAARALREAGASAVWGAAVARVWGGEGPAPAQRFVPPV